MSVDPPFSQADVRRSNATERHYLLHRGLVQGEVPPQAAGDTGRELPVDAELDYYRRKAGNLLRYRADLEQMRDPNLGSMLPLRTYGDFRLSDHPRPPYLVPPRLVQLGNLNCYSYAHIGWRYLVRPAPNELEFLRRAPIATLVADAGVPAFVDREQGEVVREIHDARHIIGHLGSHPDVDPMAA